MPSLPLSILLMGFVKDVDEEEESVESKFEKMDDQDDIHTAYEKLYKVFENIRNFIGWSPKNSVMWNLIMRNYPLSLMRLIRQLEN